MNPVFYIDVAPMQEFHFTGIPQVAAKLCEQALRDPDVVARFFLNRHEIPREIVESALRTRSGAVLRWAAERYCFKPILPRPDERVWGLHTNVKLARRIFPCEGQIIHDLTPVVTPQHHTDATNWHHQTRFHGDLLSNDVTFTVSQSTADDVRTYYPDVSSPIIVNHLGVDWDHVPADVRAERLAVEDYVFVLGTLEPRKNVAVVLDMLKATPEFAERHRVVFGGRLGWGRSLEAQLEDRQLGELARRGRVVETGFISEAVKYRLLKNARAVVYPSIYEGFGLPVAEAISVGTPVVTTPSSSLPEVGGELATYFLPGDPASLARALEAAMGADRRGRATPDAALEAWLRHFSWARCYDALKAGFATLEGRP